MSHNLLGSGTLRIVYSMYDIQFSNHETNVIYSPIMNYNFRNNIEFELRASRAGFVSKIESEITLINDTDMDLMKDLIDIINSDGVITLYPAYVASGSPISYSVRYTGNLTHDDIHKKLRVGQAFKLTFEESAVQSTIAYEV